MSYTPYKCIGCGANLDIDDKSERGQCEFCKTPYINANYKRHTTENSYSAPGQMSGNVNNTYPPPVQQRIPPRPRVSGILAFFLLCFYFFPGIIYIAIVKHSQREWDAKYTHK